VAAAAAAVDAATAILPEVRAGTKGALLDEADTEASRPPAPPPLAALDADDRTFFFGAVAFWGDFRDLGFAAAFGALPAAATARLCKAAAPNSNSW